jgi:hypothetical protein
MIRGTIIDLQAKITLILRLPQGQNLSIDFCDGGTVIIDEII